VYYTWLCSSVGSICKPTIGDVASPLYCGLHPYDNFPVEQHVQRTYTCGYSGGALRTVNDNDYAIYTTVPDQNTLNLVELVVDGPGNRWGFVNNFMPKRSEV